jgi:NhaP-type Na+/H+ or K+/H+ antiporter
VVLVSLLSQRTTVIPLLKKLKNIDVDAIPGRLMQRWPRKTEQPDKWISSLN